MLGQARLGIPYSESERETWMQAVLDLQPYNMRYGLVPWFMPQPGRRWHCLPLSCVIRTGALAQSYWQDKQSLLRRMGVTCVARLRFLSS